MAKNLKAADLIGKTVSVKGIDAKYVIKSVDGDKLMTDFYRAKDAQPISCPLPWATLEAKLKEGVYIIAGASEECRVKSEESATATVDEVEEVEDVQPQPAKTTKKPRKSHKEPKAKSEGRGKKEDVKAQPSALKYSTYTNKKGKTCAKIIGFGENDAAYVNAADLHGSATYERDKQGEKMFYLSFGPRYVAAAKEVCDALNAGKSFADCKAIVDAATEERAQKREEWKRRSEERRVKSEESATATVGYSDKDVAEMLKKIMDGGEIPEKIKAAMAA